MKRACQSVSIKRLEWHVHGSDRRRRARVGRKSREGGGSARLLNVGVRETSRERRGLGERLRDGDDIRAVDHRARVLTEHSKLGHCSCERAHHVLLVVDVRLPEACGTGHQETPFASTGLNGPQLASTTLIENPLRGPVC